METETRKGYVMKTCEILENLEKRRNKSLPDEIKSYLVISTSVEVAKAIPESPEKLSIFLEGVTAVEERAFNENYVKWKESAKRDLNISLAYIALAHKENHSEVESALEDLLKVGRIKRFQT